MAKLPPSKSPSSSPRDAASMPVRAGRIGVLAGLLLLLLSIPWITWLAYENVRASGETLEQIASPDLDRQTLEALRVDLAETGLAVMRFAASGEDREVAEYQTARAAAEQHAEELGTAWGDTMAVWLDTLEVTMAAKFALLDEWVDFSNRRRSLRVDDLDGLLSEARSLNADTLLDAGTTRLRKKDYATTRQTADSLRQERMDVLAKLEAQVDALPAAVMRVDRARRAQSARLASRDADLDAELAKITERLFQYANTRGERLANKRRDEINDLQQLMIVFSVAATIFLFLLGLGLVVLFQRGDRFQAALARTLDQERSLVQAREAFLANMSHEIRTPLHAINGFAERIATGVDDKIKSAEYGRNIGEAGHHLLELVEHILAYARMRGQASPPSQVPFSPQTLLREVSVLLGPRAEAKGLALEYQATEQMPAALLGDPLRLRQILLNLGGNSIRYTEQGKVLLRATGQQMPDKRFRLVLSVEDSGPGISAADQERIFEPFRQVSENRLASREGLGLGLAICRELADQMGGKMGLDSTPGRGSLFHLEIILPLAEGSVVDPNNGLTQAQDQTHAQFQPPAPTKAKPHAGSSAEPHARTNAEPPAPTKATPHAGSSAEPHARTNAEPPAPAKAKPHAGSSAEPHARTNAEPHARTNAEPPAPTNTQGHAHTGLDKAPLRPSGKPESAHNPGEHAAQNHTRILAVDDEPFNRRLLAAQLSEYPVRMAASAEEALELYTEQPADILLLDWRMPGMDGADLLRTLRERFPAVPAIALTAQAGPEAEAQLLAAGFQAVLAKPFSREALLALLTTLIPLSNNDSGQQQAASSVPDAEPPLPKDPGTLDTSDLVALAGEDRTFVADMLAIFLERVEETLTRWESAIEAGDREAIAAATHRLAAPARQLGFAELAAALRALEQDAEGDASMASLANRCRRLQPLLHTASLRAAAELDGQPPAQN